MSAEDARALGLGEGDAVRLTSRTGTFTGRARIDRMKPGNLEVHWPEANVLLSRDEIDLMSHEPDYNAVVTAEPVAGS
jgi:anaerobic selenocysteine-containing dehydrogenase